MPAVHCEELSKFGEKIEGIDRSSLVGSARDVTVIPTSIARAASRNQGGSLRPQISAYEQASQAAAEAADHVFEPPAGSATREAEAEAAAVEPPRAPRRR